MKTVRCVYIPDRWKKCWKVQFFSSDQYLCLAKVNNNQSFYQLFFLLNKYQITEILKNLSDLLYHNLVGYGIGQGRVVKNGKFTAADQSKQQLISQNWSVTLTVVVKKKKTSTLRLILMNQLTWPLINFLFLK